MTHDKGSKAYVILLTLAVSWTFPELLGNVFLNEKFHGGFPFWIYGTMCILTVFFIWKLMPETKGKILEKEIMTKRGLVKNL